VLDDAWSEPGTAVVELIAPGGTGKTALAKRWLDGLRAKGWNGAARVYGWSFYSQGTGEGRQASEDHFLAAAIDWFSIEIEASANPADKGRALADALAASRTLLVLDGLEPLQYPPGPMAGELRAPGLKTLLTQLAAAGHPGLCLLTSREWLQDLGEWVRKGTNPNGAVLRLDLGNLSDADGAALLHAGGANQAGAAAIGPEDEELKQASREVRGHALTLSLLGRYLARTKGGDIRQRDRVGLTRADRDARGHAAKVVAAYETWFAREGEQRSRELAALRLLGFFDRPAGRALLDALREAPPIVGLTEALQGVDEDTWRATLANLADCGLVQPDSQSGALDAHPLVREHLAETLQRDLPQAWREGHRRLYEWLKTNTPHQPEGLAGLQPLYQAVAHGCLAGLWEESCVEVYRDRILRGMGSDGFYTIKQLGAFGADLAAAVAQARHAVSYADRSGDAFQRMSKHIALADALHQQGERGEALAAFAEAEGMQAEDQPEYPLLYSLQGFRYCDLLLAGAERDAWAAMGSSGKGGTEDQTAQVAACEEVAGRVEQTLEWAEANQAGLLDFALNHLTLARAALYQDQIRRRPPGPEARAQSQRALDRLRAAGRQDYLPLGLLTRAWLRHALGEFEAARADLDEAERIASRGAMALHLADIALTRARLFHDRQALAQARALIEKHGYHRRLPELEDAEAAAANWPAAPATPANAAPTIPVKPPSAPIAAERPTVAAQVEPATPTPVGSRDGATAAPLHSPASLGVSAMHLDHLPEKREGLLPVAGSHHPDRDLDLILVHGLGGDAFTTWMADPECMETFWPAWLGVDRPRLGIWTLGYAANASGWKAESMALADRGTQVLDQMETEGLGERPLVFVTHSLGGIVAKQVLRHAVSFGVPRWRRIAEQTRGIAFIATPHSGANLASFAEFASAVFRTNEQVKELASHDARLRELHTWFRGFYAEQCLNCRTWCERR
ncbi:MAG: hypothetical protein KDG55_21645, partial [Rhodocyclaceae bacterium]|nr:hypothetical protein [Rhodocyclaceae bacterium]